MNLTEEQLLIIDAVKEFVETEVLPEVTSIEEENFPHGLFERTNELGLQSMTIPEEYGGLGESFVTHLLIIEEIAKENVMLSIAGTSPICEEIICEVGTQEQKDRILPEYVGKAKMAGFAFSEPSAGSDAGGIETTAVKDGDEWVINGQKTFISYIGVCEAFLVSARTNETGEGGVSAFWVEKDTPGVSVGTMFHKLGFRGSDTGELFFNDVRIPATNLVGKENKGLHVVLRALDTARMGTATAALGLAEGALTRAVEFIKDRKQFGKSISSFQGIQWYLAEMETDIQAAKALIYRTAEAYDKGENVTVQIAEAKLFATAMAVRVTTKAVQLCGGYGLCDDFGLERYFRDAKVLEVVEGTSEILKIVVSRGVLSR